MYGVTQPFLSNASHVRCHICQHLTEKADVYSMGMIFFAMIAGRLPYYGDPAALDASFARKGRPAIDPIWHEGFMEVRTCFMSYRIVNIFLFSVFL